MRLYLLSTVDRVCYRYDYYDGHIVAAHDTTTARELANNVAKCEGHIWADTSSVTCRSIGAYTGPRIRPHIVLSSFNAG